VFLRTGVVFLGRVFVVIVFLDFGDHDASCSVVVDDHIVGGQFADFTGDTPTDEEAVAEEILVEGVFVVILRVWIVEELVDHIGEREDPYVGFGCARWLVRLERDPVSLEEHPHGFPFVNKRMRSRMFDLLSIIHVSDEVFQGWASEIDRARMVLHVSCIAEVFFHG